MIGECPALLCGNVSGHNMWMENEMLRQLTQLFRGGSSLGLRFVYGERLLHQICALRLFVISLEEFSCLTVADLKWMYWTHF